MFVSLLIDFFNNIIHIRPVLLWASGATIKAAQMKSTILDFKVTEVYTSSLICNARNVEDAIQRRLQHLKLGSQRLHRYVGKGQRYANKLGLPRCHRVFITTSSKVQDPIKKQIIIVNN